MGLFTVVYVPNYWQGWTQIFVLFYFFMCVYLCCSGRLWTFRLKKSCHCSLSGYLGLQLYVIAPSSYKIKKIWRQNLLCGSENKIRFFFFVVVVPDCEAFQSLILKVTQHVSFSLGFWEIVKLKSFAQLLYALIARVFLLCVFLCFYPSLNHI